MKKFPFPLPTRYEYTGDRMTGGQGHVYVCHDNYLERKVAIKVMKARAGLDDLKRELVAMCKVASAHVAQVYDLISSKGGTLGLVEEFVPGERLDEYAANRDISPQEYLKILYQIARGLADIHESGKVHRDIKPQNLKFDAENILKILDFGLSRDLSLGDETTKARGTRGFLGPEFYSGPTVRFSPASDTYAFGVVAWSLATGEELPPALSEEPPQSLTDMPSFSTLRTPPPTEVAKILDAALSPEPRRRPSMKAVAATLGGRLVFGRHRATLSLNQAKHQLSGPGKSIRLTSGPCSITIRYDGLGLRVAQAEGDVYINNLPATKDSDLPKSCVVTMGAPHLGAGREFVPVDSSQPEIVL